MGVTHGSQPGEHRTRVTGRKTPAENFADAVLPGTGNLDLASNRGIVSVAAAAGTPDRFGRTKPGERITFQVSPNTRTENGATLNNPPFDSSSVFAQAVRQGPDGQAYLARVGLEVGADKKASIPGVTPAEAGPPPVPASIDGAVYHKAVWSPQANSYVAQGDPVTPPADVKARLDGVLAAAQDTGLVPALSQPDAQGVLRVSQAAPAAAPATAPRAPAPTMGA